MRSRGDSMRLAARIARALWRRLRGAPARLDLCLDAGEDLTDADWAPLLLEWRGREGRPEPAALYERAHVCSCGKRFFPRPFGARGFSASETCCRACMGEPQAAHPVDVIQIRERRR